MLPTPITSSITEDQKKQYRSIVENATRKGCDLTLQQVALDNQGLQKLMSRGDQFSAAIARRMISEARVLTASNQPDTEEVESNFGYLSDQRSGYKSFGLQNHPAYKPKAIAVQMNRLRDLIPGVGASAEKVAERPLPEGAEGYFTIPRWETIAPSYGEALGKMLALIEKTQNGMFFNYRAGNLGPQYLCEHKRSVAMWKRIGEAQKGYDVLVVPAQFGVRHRGRSVRRAREVMGTNEFGLGAFAVAVMLLTHPERLMDYDDLWINCPGDEYAPDGDGRFAGAPFFLFYKDETQFDAIDYTRAKNGSASGFLPQ